jgi:hypothetical protein
VEQEKVFAIETPTAQRPGYVHATRLPPRHTSTLLIRLKGAGFEGFIGEDAVLLYISF